MYSNDLPDMSEALRQVYEKKNNDGNLANNAVPYDKVTKADIITGAKGKDEQGGKKKPKGHDCAKLVKYEGKEYDVIPEAHTLLEDGTVTHYDIEDAEYIYENVPVEDLEILISEKHEHFANYDKNAEVLGEGIDAKGAARMDAAKGKKKETQDEIDKRLMMGKYSPSVRYAKKEAFAFSEEDFAELETLGEEIDSLTDEQLIDVMEDIILEMAQDDQDLIEICEHLETVEVLDERMDPKEIQRRRDQAKDRLSTGASMKKAAAKSDSAPAPASAGPSRMDRLKSAAKKAGSAIKSGAKKVGKKAVQTAGKVAGEFSASKEKQKSSAMEREPKSEKEPKEAPKKSSGVTRSTVPSSSAGGGGSSSGGGSSESGSTRKAVGGALRKVGSLLKRGVKKAVGKTSRLVAKGSDKLAKRLGEEYDEIASLYESGLFTIEEIENIVEEKKPLPKNKMFRKAGNLGREVVSPSVTDDQRQKAYDRSKKIVKTLNKENQK